MEPYRHRVLYGDTDQMGVVYYANYLRFFEGARGEWIRALGLTYAQIEERGIFLPVLEVGVRYLKPARYDDELDIHLDVSHTRVKVRFDYRVHRKGTGGEGLGRAGRTPEAAASAVGEGLARAGRTAEAAASSDALILGHTVHACVGREGRPVRAPDWLITAMEGASTLHVRLPEGNRP